MQHALGHSFRIGSAVALLLTGVPPEIIAATGGWSSLAFLLYWCRLQEVIPMHVTKAYNKNRKLVELDTILDKFRKDNCITNEILDACINELSKDSD